MVVYGMCQLQTIIGERLEMNSECGEMSRFGWCGWRKSISGKVVTLLENLGQLFLFFEVLSLWFLAAEIHYQGQHFTPCLSFLIAVKICVVSVLRVI